MAFEYNSIGDIYDKQRDYAKAKENFQQSIAWLSRTVEEDQYFLGIPLTNIGIIYFNRGQIDPAFLYARKALAVNEHASNTLLLLGDIEEKAGNHKNALDFYKRTIMPGGATTANAEAYGKIANVFSQTNQDNLHFTTLRRKLFCYCKYCKNPFTIINSGNLLVNLFRSHLSFDSAFFYQDLVMQAKDSVFNQEKERQIHNIYFNEKLSQQELEARMKNTNLKIKSTCSGILTLLLVTGFVYRARMRSRFYKQLSEIEMRALRAQMNPHFIFNCLSSINRYIVKSDTKTASGYITKFSKLIRLILDD